MHRAGTGLRWGRAVVLAAVAMLTGTLAHVTADGGLPGPVGLALILAATTAAVAPLLARPASALRVVALTVGAQTAIHLALSVTGGHGEPRPRATPAPPPELVPLPTDASGARVGSLMDQYAAAPGGGGQLTVPEPILLLVSELSGPQAWMTLLHVAAAAAVGLWLAMGERAVWALADLAVRRVLPALRPVLLPLSPVRPRPAPPRLRAAPRLRVLARVVVRRGPPALLAA